MAKPRLSINDTVSVCYTGVVKDRKEREYPISKTKDWIYLVATSAGEEWIEERKLTKLKTIETWVAPDGRC